MGNDRQTEPELKRRGPTRVRDRCINASVTCDPRQNKSFFTSFQREKNSTMLRLHVSRYPDIWISGSQRSGYLRGVYTYRIETFSALTRVSPRKRSRQTSCLAIIRLLPFSLQWQYKGNKEKRAKNKELLHRQTVRSKGLHRRLLRLFVSRINADRHRCVCGCLVAKVCFPISVAFSCFTSKIGRTISMLTLASAS